MSSDRPVNVMVTTSLPDNLLARVSGVDKRSKVVDAAALLLEELPEALRPGQQAAPRRAPNGQSLDQLFAKAEVILSARRIPQGLVRRAPGLRWIQLPMAGVDWLQGSDLWGQGDIVITSAAGINAPPVAEYVIAMMLALAKDMRRLIHSQAAHDWDRYEMGQLDGKTLGLVGYGYIAQGVAARARGFGMRVLATRRRRSAEEPDGVEMLSVDQLPLLLASSDFVVLGVPATAQTKALIGRKELEAMRPSAFLINIARGDVVDEPALIEALAAGRIAGAALDVFQQEPLPTESPLWDMRNVIVTGHLGGLFEAYDEAVVDLFVENLHRYVDGRPLINEVDRRAGY